MTTYSYEYRSTVEYRQKVQPVTVCVLQKNLVPPRDQMQLLKSAAVRDLDFFGIATTSTYVGAFNDLYEYVAKTPDAIAAIKFNGKWTYITSGVTSALFVDSVYSDMREKNMSLLQSSLSNSAAYAASKYVFDIGSKATQTITDPYLKAAGLGLTLITSASTYYYVDELSAGMLNQVSSAMNKDESWNVRLPVNRELHFPVSGTDIGPDDQPADIVNKLSSLGIPVSSLTLTGGCSDLTYTVVKGDTISQIAAAKGLTTQELLDRNSWLTDQGRVSADGKYVLIKPGETLDLAGITFVTQYEYDSIKAMYDDSSTEGFGLNIVTNAEYNDWKRDAAISAFNLFGQPAIPQLAPLSLLSSDVQSVMNSLTTSMSDMGFTDSMQLSVLPSIGSTSLLSDSDYEYPWAIDQDIEDYNANLITSMPADFESQMAASVNNFWNGLTFDTGIGTVQVGGGTTYGGSGGGTPYVGVNFGCPIGIDLGNDTMPLDQQGLSQVSMFNSTAFFDMDGDGYKERTGWVGPDDGLLVIDLDNDGVIDKATEVSFKLWSPDATSDLDGLRLAFDSNTDGVFNAQDARFSEFRIWQDQNQNGISEAGELTTLAERGLVADLLLAA